MNATPTTTTVPRRGMSWRTAALAVLVAALIVFCALNRTTLYVWPFGRAPLFVVIVTAYVLGAASGWIGSSMRGRRRRRAQED